MGVGPRGSDSHVKGRRCLAYLSVLVPLRVFSLIRFIEVAFTVRSFRLLTS